MSRIKTVFATRTRKVVAVAGVGVTTLVLAGAAYAFFAAEGSSAPVSQNTSKTAQVSAITLGVTAGPSNDNVTIAPDGVAHLYSFSVKNPDPKYTANTNYAVVLGGLSPACATAAGTVNTPSGWFTLNLNHSTAIIAPGVTDSVVATLTMPGSLTVDQSVCENQQPTLTLTAS